MHIDILGDEAMEQSCYLDWNTQTYLNEYHCILDQMIEKMTTAQLSCSISHNFIVQMIPHHRAAILMSCNLLKYTKNEFLQEIAFGIIKEQTRSIENMRNILCTCQNRINNKEHLCQYQDKMDTIMQTMFTQMTEACFNNDININFIKEMVPHHEGAIAMSKTTLEYDICPELKPILEAIIISQSRGVQQLKSLLQNLNCD